MRVSALVVAAGRGIRIKSKVSKPLIKIRALPLIVYCLRQLNRQPQVKEIILVANRANRAAILRLVKKYRISKVKQVVLGGRLRRDSVRMGLTRVDKSSGVVLVHDAVRPFVSAQIISQTIGLAARHGAAVAAVPVKATIKEASQANNKVKRTLKRGCLWEIHTPQAFKKELLLEAFRRFPRAEATDDAALVEKMGYPVRLVLDSYYNIKLTTPEDLLLAEAIAKKWNIA